LVRGADALVVTFGLGPLARRLLIAGRTGCSARGVVHIRHAHLRIVNGTARAADLRAILCRGVLIRYIGGVAAVVIVLLNLIL
jgi:hypothetical protein